MGELATDLEELLALLTSPNRAPWWAAVLLEKLDKIHITQERYQEKLMATLDDLTALGEAIQALEQSIQQATTGAGQYQSEIAALKAQLATANQTITTDQATITADEATISADAAANTQADQQVQALQAQVASLASQVQALITAETPPSPPTVTAVAPTTGSDAGGDIVTVTGSGFTGATAVNFGTIAGSTLAVVSDTSLTVVSPPSPDGQVDITVVTPAGTSTTSATDQFTFAPPVVTPPPAQPSTVTAVSPATGSDQGGDTVTVTGTGFFGGGTTPAVSAVNFGTAAGTGVTVASDTSLTVVSPAGADGPVDITVTTPAGTSATTAADQFSYAPVTTTPPPPALPTVTGVSAPAGGGNPAGGDSVAITGTGFTGAAAVQFGSVPATSFTVTDDSDITAVSPADPNAAGGDTVDITVVTSAGTSATSAADQFTYAAASSGTTTTTTTTPVPVDPTQPPVPAGTLNPSTEVVEVPAGVVPVVVPAGAVAVQAGTLPPDAIVTPVQTS